MFALRFSSILAFFYFNYTGFCLEIENQSASSAHIHQITQAEQAFKAQLSSELISEFEKLKKEKDRLYIEFKKKAETEVYRCHRKSFAIACKKLDEFCTQNKAINQQEKELQYEHWQHLLNTSVNKTEIIVAPPADAQPVAHKNQNIVNNENENPLSQKLVSDQAEKSIPSILDNSNTMSASQSISNSSSLQNATATIPDSLSVTNNSVIHINDELEIVTEQLEAFNNPFNINGNSDKSEIVNLSKKIEGITATIPDGLFTTNDSLIIDDKSIILNYSKERGYVIKSVGVLLTSGLSFVIAHKVITPWIVKKLPFLLAKTHFSTLTKDRLKKVISSFSTGIITVLGGVLSLIPSSLLFNHFFVKNY